MKPDEVENDAAPLFCAPVISTGGSVSPGRNGEIWRSTRGAFHSQPDPSTALRSVQDDKQGNGLGRDASARSGFMLIELLVVISIVVLLMALLLPALSRARKQAQAVVCQAKLRQWGLVFKTYLDDHDGRFWDSYPRHEWAWRIEPYRRDYPDLGLCPLATKFNRQDPVYSTWRVYYTSPISHIIEMSYGVNRWLSFPLSDALQPDHYWGTCEVKGIANIPVLFDAADIGARPFDKSGPCELEDVGIGRWNMCIDRHGGGINMLFMDWSVRKVGVKEPWTLKWSRKFDTAGPWTKRGGVLPEDWPAWMRKFKDY